MLNQNSPDLGIQNRVDLKASRSKLGVRVPEELYLSGCVFLQALDARPDSFQFSLSPVDVEADIANQIRLV